VFGHYDALADFLAGRGLKVANECMKSYEADLANQARLHRPATASVGTFLGAARWSC
jgi:hypothetical protein